jgi:integrase
MVWTPEQAGAFLDFAATDELYALWHLIAFRGLHRSEALGLPWADVDLDRRTVTIREARVQVGRDVVAGDPPDRHPVRLHVDARSGRGLVAGF